MLQLISVITLTFAVFIGAGMYFAELPSKLLGNDCLEIYEDILPLDIDFVKLEKGEETVQVYYSHAGNEDSVICGLDENGDVDFITSMNRKIDIWWDDPTIEPRFD
jgi:hypothetical protein